MKKIRFILTAILFVTGSAALAQAQTTYWLGTKNGNELRFNVQVPKDAAAIIMNASKAPDGDGATVPRYRTFTQNIGGKIVVFHANEIGWETPKLDDGGLTWVTESGVGAEWRECDTKDPLWRNFAAALRNLATPFSEGWSQAKVVIAEGIGKTAPTARLNLEGAGGGSSSGGGGVKKEVAGSTRCSGVKTPLSDAEIDEILRVHNAARAAVGSPAVTWNCKLAEFAQSWADKDVFEHSNENDQKDILGEDIAGENLSADADASTVVKKMLQGWLDEKPNWNNAAKTCAAGKVCGHYTQMVWKTTTQVGCGINRKASVMGDPWKGTTTYLVCNYFPGGNNGEDAF